MIKLIGILLAVIGAGAVGYLKAWEIKRRRVLLLDFKEMMLHISTEMCYFKEPLPQIFRRLSEGQRRESKTLLEECLNSYGSGVLSMGEIWSRAVEKVYRGTSLTAEDLTVMKKCGEFLGKSDFKGQQEHFQLLGIELDRQTADAEETIRTKGRLYGKMGVAAGLVIAIVFI